MNYYQLGCIALAAPLVGVLFAYIYSYKNWQRHYWICVATIAVSFISCLVILYSVSLDGGANISLFKWIKVEKIKILWGFLFDPLSALMMVLVNFISLLVHIYSLGYMSNDPGKMRFFGHLNLFTFMMLLLVCSPNFLQLFCGWEGVSLASYLLIGYWHEKNTAVAASIKAFVVNRVGDIGLILAAGAIFSLYKTLNFKDIFLMLENQHSVSNIFLMNVIGIFLFLAAMGKSGQLGLHVWLPDAMEAPTPVSALLHAATMVTAGVFLVIRFSPLFELAPFAKQIMMVIGLLTGLVAGLIAICQTDIKKIIAYSTCSQLGMMFMACAAGAYTVAFFHLFTHAFFKALLFLGAGAVIHAMSHEQNIMHMGGLKTYLQSNYYAMMIGTLSLCGFPFLAGYYSKDLIFESIYFAQIPFAYFYYFLCMVLTFITGLYSWRLIFLVFHGSVNSDEQVMAHIHKVPKTMQYVVYVLAFFGIVAGYFGFKLIIEQTLGFLWNHSVVFFEPMHAPLTIKLLPLFFAVAALWVSYSTYIKKTGCLSGLSSRFSGFYKLLNNKFYFDEIYQVKIVKPCVKLGKTLYKNIDREVIDKCGPDGLANIATGFGKILQKIQSGYLFYYCFIVGLGLILILGAYLSMQLFPNIAKDLKLLIGRL